MSELLNNYCSLTLSRPVPHSVIWVCLQPFPPVRPQTAGLYCFPFFTNTCSIPTWWPAILCRNDRHRFPSFQGGLRGSTSRAPRPVLLLPVSGMVRYLPPWEVNCITEKERTVNMGLHGSLRQKTKHRGMFRLGFFFVDNFIFSATFSGTLCLEKQVAVEFFQLHTKTCECKSVSFNRAMNYIQ